MKKPGALRNGAPFKDWDLPPALAQVRVKLRSHADGDRQFVKVLGAVLDHSLAAGAQEPPTPSAPRNAKGAALRARVPFSCSSWLTRSTRLKNRPRARLRMTAAAMAMHRWVLPVTDSTDKDAVALGVQKSAGRELGTLPLIDWCVGEDEASKILQHR